MFDASSVWNVAAGASIALTLWAVVVVVLAIAKSWRLSADYRVIEAAERFEAVNLTSVVKRYVPSEQQSNKVADEIAIAKQIISSRRPRWKRAASISGVVMLCSAGAAAFAIQRDLSMPALPAAKQTVSLNVLKDIQGVWGWKADAEQSCEENPQTITVTPDGKKVSIRYAKPYHSGSRTITSTDFDVVSIAPDALVLSRSDSVSVANPVRVNFQFINANAFALGWSNDPAKSSGTIARCHS